MTRSGGSAIYDPREHAPLAGDPWSEDIARATIAEIVDTIVAGWSPEHGWPMHPDEFDEPRDGPGDSSIYCGAAGNIWLLKSLQDAGYASGLDLLSMTLKTPQLPAMATQPWVETSYMLGPLGMALVAALCGDLEPRIEPLVARNLDNPSHELFVGAPGSMLAALEMYERTSDRRWSDLFERGMDSLWPAWSELRPGAYLWKQHLYGRDVPSYVGPGHGFAGNVAIMLRGVHLIDDARRREIYRRAISTVKALAVRDGAIVNWPVTLQEENPRWRMQWCHGSPGMVAALNAVPAGIDADFDRLMLECAETTWQVGPLAKGPSLCHGTSGNGFTFLKIYERTRDDLWLQRARAFAMHAISQMHAEHKRWKRPWFSLWTGDAGVAHYLRACIEGSSGILTFDRVYTAAIET